MTKSNSKKSLVASGLSLAVSCALLLGTTFAWFTDSVTSTGNKIQAGNLDVALEEWNGTAYEDVGSDPIFDYDKWEPGYSDIAAVRIANNGSLALKYQLDIVPESQVSALADVIDVYYYQGGDAANGLPDNFGALDSSNYERVGTLADVLARENGAANGHLEAGEAGAATYDYAIIVLHMQEEAGNEYKGLSIGTTFDIVLKATQYTSEEDGFGNPDYDADADWAPVSVSDADELVQALADAQPGDVLSLEAGTYALTDSLVVPSGVSLIGKQAGTPASQWVNADDSQKTIIKAPETGDRVLQILQDDAASPVSNVVLDGIEIDGENRDVKGVYVKKSTGDAMQGIAIRNCAVVNTANDGIDVSNTDGAVIENNYVSGVADNGIRLGNYKNTDGNIAYVRDNVIDTVSATQNGAIMIESGAGDVVVSGNVISNVTAYEGSNGSSEMKRSAIHVYDVAEGGTITIENNTIANVDQGIAVYKFSSLADGDKVVIRSNTITGYKDFAVATSTLNSKKFDVTALVEITDNDFSTEETAAAGLYIEKTNQFGETTANWRVEAGGNTAGDDVYTG